MQHADTSAPSSSGHSIVVALRRIPRVAWLSASVVTLLLASLFWIVRLKSWIGPGEPGYQLHAEVPALSRKWWSDPIVARENRALPDILGRINGFAIQRVDDKIRIWIVSPGGYLAYSDDDGQCWVAYEYDKATGQLHPPATSPCQIKGQTLLHWPEIVPRVYAAASAQSKLVVSPSFVHFDLPSTAVQQGPALLSKTITVSNVSSSGVHVDVKFDAGREFTLESKCTGRTLSPKQSCDLIVHFNSQARASKSATLYIIGDGGQIRVPIEAGVAGVAGNANNPPDVRNQVEAAANQPAVNQAADTAPQAGGKGPVPRLNPPTVEPFTPPATLPDLLAIEITGRSGMIVGSSGSVWISGDGGATWNIMPRHPAESLTVAGIVWNLTGNEPWADQTAIAKSEYSKSFVDYFVGLQCTVPFSVRFENTLYAAGCVSDDKGAHAVLKRSSDNGKTWTALTRGALPESERAQLAGHPWIWLPRWFMAALALSLILAAPALLPPLPKQRDLTSVEAGGEVEDRLSSDRPLSPGDFDALGLGNIALGLSRFLRNQKTQPPLTVAINGEWGTGKSSLMNLLRCDLQSYGMRPVWFNAWHHQKEEHLLAALLQTIRMEGVPKPSNLLGVPYRLRLLARRIMRHLPRLIVLVAISIFLVMLDVHLRQHEKEDLFLWLGRTIVPSLTSNDSKPVSDIPVQGGLIAILLTAGALWRGLTAFGANPAALLASVAKGNRMKDLEAQTSFRQKFAEEFLDFTTALGETRPLVIFIDDLDRCQPDNVREILEAVNYLVSSGNCFVILGMDRVQVQRAVGLSFSDVALEASSSSLGASATAADKEELARRKRAEFAQKYLEKLVNLEVRIPLAEEDGVKQKLFQYSIEPPPVPLRERIVQGSLKALQWAVPAAVTILLIIGAVRLSTIAVPGVERLIESTQPAPKADTPRTTLATTGATTSSPDATPAKATERPAESKPNETVVQVIPNLPGSRPTVTPGKTGLPPRWALSLPFYSVSLILLLVLDVILTTRPGVVTRDSKNFTNAMQKIWYPLVLAKQNTPRAAKRFINRVRYLAMRQRGSGETVSWWERTLFPDRLPEPTAPSKDFIPEPFLVALASIEQIEPDWIYNEGLFKSLLVDDKDFGNTPNTTNADKLFLKARADHKSSFIETKYEWNKIAGYRNKFLEIWPKLIVSDSNVDVGAPTSPKEDVPAETAKKIAAGDGKA